MFAFILFAGIALQAGSAPARIQERVGATVNADAKPDDLKSPHLPPGISLDRPLEARDAVAIALWNNAAFHADLAGLGLARADLAEAGLLRNPNLSLLFPVGPKPFELAATLPIEAFWQRPRRIEAAKASLDVVAEGLVQHGIDLARDATLAWIDLALAQQRSAIQAETADLKDRIAEMTELRLRAGDISEGEAGMARADAVAARDAARRSESEIPIAVERLRMQIGLRGDRSPLKVAALQEPAAPLPKLDNLLEAAFGARPDLRAAELAVQAAARRARWEHSRVVALGVVLSSKEVGTSGVRTGPGLSLDLPIFNRNQGAIRRADAEVERTAWQYLAARDRVEADVRDARAHFVRESQSLERMRADIIPSLRRNAESVEISFRNGDVSYLTVLEASRPLTEIRAREVEAAAALCRADAELERSIGRKP